MGKQKEIDKYGTTLSVSFRPVDFILLEWLSKERKSIFQRTGIMPSVTEVIKNCIRNEIERTIGNENKPIA
jgi:hypothetical protein